MHLCIPDGDEPLEGVDVRREERRIRRELRRLRYTSRMVDRRQYRGADAEEVEEVRNWTPGSERARARRVLNEVLKRRGGRVLDVVGTPTEEDVAQIRRLLDERKEGAR